MEYIAHRGASGFAPENTVEAFALARNMGMSSYELDVHLTKDNMLVVHHDFDLERTAGVKLVIAQSTYKELAALNVAAHFGANRPPARIPLLEEALAAVGDKAFMNIEIKNENSAYHGIEQKLLDKINSLGGGWLKRISFSSFEHSTLATMRDLYAKARIGVLANAAMGAEIALETAAKVKAESINLSGKIITPEIVRRAHAAGFKVLVYTINDRKTAELLEAVGVDGIFTDRPDICQKGWDKIGLTT